MVESKNSHSLTHLSGFLVSLSFPCPCSSGELLTLENVVVQFDGTNLAIDSDLIEVRESASI